MSVHTCLECHDGVLAQHMINHPVDIDYATSFLNKRAALRPIDALPAAIRLQEGQVVCITCHDLASSLPSKLTLPLADSALCFACHDR